MASVTSLYTLEQNMRLLELALECLFIYPSDKEKINRLLEENATEESGINVTDIFRQETLVSDEKIERLLALDRHMQTQQMDQQFGTLAIANDLASKEDVAQALKYQKAYFEKTGITMEIGDTLVDNKTITPGDRISILLTQNRIKDKNLLEALNEIGETQRQKDAVNGRFGVLAIKKGLVTFAQVTAALEVQKKQKNTQGDARFIGQILQETGLLSDDDILEVLLEQRQFEKRRLDLESALYTVQSEIKISKKLNRLFEYQISKDGIEAFAKKQMEPDPAIPVYEFLIWLRRAGIRFGIVNDTILEDFIQTAQKNFQILVAKGYPPEPCTNESIQFYFKGDESILVKKNNILARIIPGKQGKPGKNVLGYPILPDTPSICVLNAGSNVVKKGLVFLARTEGRPVVKNGTTLMVEPAVQKIEIKTINGNITNDTQDTYESTSVVLSGTITPEAVLRCHSLLLHGALMGCAICDTDIDVRGNIGIDETPQNKETLHRTGIICQGSVKASKSIINSKILTSGELQAFNSMVIGSEVIACKGMSLKSVLKGENGPSILQFGLKPGDTLLATDHTIEIKNAELSVLRKESDIKELMEKYRKDRQEEDCHQNEQAILKNLIEISETPDLYRHERLEDKIDYLYRLPDFSSVKACYLKFPETEAAQAFLHHILESIKKMSLEHALNHIREKLDPEPDPDPAGKNAAPTTYGIETHFKARLSAFEREVAENSDEIERIEKEINGLQTLRTKLGSLHTKSLSQSLSVIKIKNQCEKGTIIKGKIAWRVLDKTLYNVKFKEVMDPKSNTASITIEAY